MKHFFLILSGISFISLSHAQDVTGVWTWVGAGCRDSSLSASSHRTKPKSQNPFQISASQLTLNADFSASMYIDVAGQRQDETGNYEVRNGQVIITDPSMSETEPALIMRIVDSNLLLSFSDIQDPDRDMDDNNSSICGSGNSYVYIFANVGS